MKETLQNTLNRSATKILRPLTRIMLRNGVSCGNFEELVRKAYVDEAFALSEEKGGKVTVSSISAQTGLSRKEVKRLHELNTEQPDPNKQKYNRATRVISGWTNDPLFSYQEGLPKPLKLNNTDTDSFAHLVKLYSGDITPKAMLELLLEAECVQTQQDTVHLTKLAYLPGNDSTEVAFILGNDTNELIQTIGHNMNSDNSGNKRFQRKVSTNKIAKEAKAAFQTMSAKHAQALLEELDAWLHEHEAKEPEDAEYVSLGIYYYESKNNKDSSHEA